MRLITIPDEFGNHEYDSHWVIPASMENDTAIKVVNKAIRKIKKKRSEGGYIFEDLQDALLALGFTYPQFVTATEPW